MKFDEISPIDQGPPSATERRLCRLVVAEPAARTPNECLDVIHDPDLGLLWGGQA